MKLFTGLQPSGALHIGNYIGALKPAVEMCKEHEGMLMVADYHALTTLREPAELRANIINATRDYLAAGIDPDKTVVFKQSDVPEHTELAWIFQCLVTVPFLELSHAYKDKVGKGLEANAGLFAYPMLMAADILLYNTDIVPVGADQRQHVEYAREAAAKFNKAFGDTFKEPKERILDAIAIVPGTDGKKMSKSYGNTIPLFGTKDEIAKAVMSIVTDSNAESPTNVYAIHALFRDGDYLGELYKTNKGKYKVLKEALIEDIEAVVAPMRERRDVITDEEVKQILTHGAERARARASAKMADVRQKIGVAL
ncbi:tryptophan--tRNA ligase [Candidatus Kaiserbacteria bacterium RIFCSPHIGHO2_02_FULL_55_25]|uniref:Tryptophan--tRNA ligase n=1 Tax=Candidatus Kaiserbacteria bacterium RIFCSPHIGHO2_02_FULL_55_25 TaxID=1798498 RepID=A0A1F6EAM1_9BACT|nr:MAG: tryptophan--tRNA ligase [Candidatus Kaiserbacteria bacterium RIFCSPHIGHO2_01_FULL_55_79]OGG70725.1 MAG: tryptophan--tRNA ligase [Candidatus Kaiserbacteria bacterium RIFCSPHIGHO2_02_FULL_55_25]OGG77109.1 MAG: tryptophan--tRNA ligase [Candidatus Kaiserbacteria bacterium RIFCSPHIGHO2_12_FULL_55_13]OGG84028.1 MAG: tryptophan--tRNA ligase [Candidatus Kaiserbacteria bacterium RIFCSPLOWO2_01_FULL_55_25]